MIHLVNEAWYSLKNAHDFVLLSFTLYRLKELILRNFSQEATLWLNDEEYDLNVSFDIDFDPSCIPFEEAVCYVILEVDKTFAVPLDYVSKLVQQIVYIEPFTDLTIKRV